MGSPDLWHNFFGDLRCVVITIKIMVVISNKQVCTCFFVSFFFLFFFVLLFFQPLYRRATSYFYLTSYFPGVRGNLFFIANGELHTDVSTKVIENVLKHST